jgi:hypothetical protein
MPNKALSGRACLWFAAAMAGCMAVACSNEDTTAATARDAAAANDAATAGSHADAAAGTHGGSDASAQNEDDGGTYDGDATCMALCKQRVDVGNGEYAPCFDKCVKDWPDQDAGCQRAAALFAACVGDKSCPGAVVQCCYSEVGRYSDLCPLSFQE